MDDTHHVDIKTPDGNCDTFIACPKGKGPFKPLLFYMDAFGPREGLYQMAQKIADRGYFVLLPNLFYRSRRAPIVDAHFPLTKDTVADAFKQLKPNLASYDPEMGMRDAQVFLDFLAKDPRVKPGKIAITGYCMGGGLALRTAARFPERVAAVGSFHAGRLVTDAPNSPHLLGRQLQARFYFGHADQDPSMPMEAIEKLEVALKEAKVQFESEVMPGAAHGYTQRDLPAYQEAADHRHWEKLWELLKD